jgi:hypothetical protein
MFREAHARQGCGKRGQESNLFPPGEAGIQIKFNHRAEDFDANGANFRQLKGNSGLFGKFLFAFARALIFLSRNHVQKRCSSTRTPCAAVFAMRLKPREAHGVRAVHRRFSTERTKTLAPD